MLFFCVLAYARDSERGIACLMLFPEVEFVVLISAGILMMGAASNGLVAGVGDSFVFVPGE